MQKAKKRFPWVAAILLLILITAIGGVVTVLVGRALGWWSYADLPVVGRFFPGSETPHPEDPVEDNPEATVSALQAELQSRDTRLAELGGLLNSSAQEVAALQAKVAELEQTLQQSHEQAVDKQLQATARMYENMRPEQAASILANYSNQEVLSLLLLMPSETSGAILAKFDPARAAAITALPR